MQSLSQMSLCWSMLQKINYYFFMWGFDCRFCQNVDENEIQISARQSSRLPLSRPKSQAPQPKHQFNTLQRDLTPVGAFHTREPPAPIFQSYSKSNLNLSTVSTRSVPSNNKQTKQQKPELDLDASPLSTIRQKSPLPVHDFQFNLEPQQDDFQSGHFSNQPIDNSSKPPLTIFSQAKSQQPQAMQFAQSQQYTPTKNQLPTNQASQLQFSRSQQQTPPPTNFVKSLPISAKESPYQSEVKSSGQYQFQSGSQMRHFQAPITELSNDMSMNSQANNNSQIHNNSQINNTSRISKLNLSASRSAPLPTITKLFSVRAHEKKITSIAIGQTYVFTSSFDSHIHIWDKQKGTLVQTLDGHKNYILCMDIIGNILATSGSDKTIKIWQGDKTFQLITSFQGHVDIITDVRFVNAQFVISSSPDKTVRLWDIKSSKQARALKFDFEVKQLKKQNQILFMAGKNMILLYTLQGIQQIKAFEAHDPQFTTEHIQPLSDNNIISVDSGAHIAIWNHEKVQLVYTFREDYRVADIVYMEQFNYIVFALCNKDGSGKLCIWSLENFKKLKEIFDNGSGAETIAWEAPVLYSGHENKRLEGWKFG